MDTVEPNACTATEEEILENSVSSCQKTAVQVIQEEQHEDKETKNSGETTGNLDKMFDFSVSDFAKLVKTTSFIDKTLMIKDIFCSSSKILITAPKAFGKSTNIDMVKRFLEIEVDTKGVAKDIHEMSNYGVFKDNHLEICNHEEFFNEHFGKHPVLYIDFGPLSGVRDFVQMLDVFKTVIPKSFNQHSYLLGMAVYKIDTMYFDRQLIRSASELDLKYSFEYLSNILYKHFGKEVFVLIDDCDAFVNSTLYKNNNSDTRKMISFIKTTMDNLLKKNSCVGHALLTGVLPVTGNGFPFHENNIECYSFLDGQHFCKYYGLTSDEVDKLLKKLIKDNEQRNKTKTVVDKYYSGYTLRDQYCHVYNMWSVLHFLSRRNVKGHWPSHENIKVLKPASENVQIQNELKRLVSGDEKYYLVVLRSLSSADILQLFSAKVEGASSSVVDTFFILLCYYGYLSTEEDSFSGADYLKIPNEEIKFELKTLFGGQTNKTLFSDSQKSKEDLSLSLDLLNGIENIIEILLKFIKNRDKNEMSECNNQNISGKQRIRKYNNWLFLQYLRRKKEESHWQTGGRAIESMKLVFKNSHIRKEMEELLFGNEVQLAMKQELSVIELVQLNYLIATGICEFKASSSVVVAVFVLLYHFGYLTGRESSDEKYVYVQIIDEKIKCDILNIILKTDPMLYCYGQADAECIRHAVDLFKPGNTSRSTFFNFGDAVQSWYHKWYVGVLFDEDRFLTCLFMMLLVTNTEYKERNTVRKFSCSKGQMLLLKNRHQVGFCITVEKQSNELDFSVRALIKCSEKVHKKITKNRYEEEVFYKYNDLLGKVVIGISFHGLENRGIDIAYSYSFIKGNSSKRVEHCSF